MDAMLVAHSRYLAAVQERALLTPPAEPIRQILQGVFETAARLLHPLQTCEAHVAAAVGNVRQVRQCFRSS